MIINIAYLSNIFDFRLCFYFQYYNIISTIKLKFTRFLLSYRDFLNFFYYFCLKNS